MLLGILSDTHNNLTNLRTALDILRREQVSTLIHCGDLTDVEAALQLAEFRVIFTFGNGDLTANEIRQNLLYFRSDNDSSLSYLGELDGVKIAATHGHLHGALENLIQSGQYAYVFHGHSHQRRDDQVGFTRVINPGALGGLKREARSFAILDLNTGKLDFQLID
jgi:putative phosphoesterase